MTEPGSVGSRSSRCDSPTGRNAARTFSRDSWTVSGRIDIDHMVPLAEAWDSGARTWTTAPRRLYAHDLGDARSLVGVTDSVNQSKGDQDVAQWQPQFSKCRYLREWVAVKHRWRMSVNSAEKSAMTNLAATCTNSTITVTRAR